MVGPIRRHSSTTARSGRRSASSPIVTARHDRSLRGRLRSRGVGHGDRVLIYMPAVPEAVAAMLACAPARRHFHSVVFGGFAANELAARFDDAKPKAIVSASCGIEGSRHVAYKPMLDRRSSWRPTSRTSASCCSGRR